MRQLMAAGLTCGIILAGAAAQAQPVVTNPEWIRRPSGEQLAAAFPRVARINRVSGRAVLRCTVTIAGLMRDCMVMEDSPPGAGFDAAALRLSRWFVMTPTIKDGKPIESQVDIPLTFRTPGAGRTYATDGGAWTAAPSSAQFEAAYPPALRGKNVSGSAAIQCRFARDGGLKTCKLIRETPAGEGFGEAAMSLLPLFRADLSYYENSSTDYPFTLPFHFVDPQSADWKNRTIPKPVWVRTASAEQVEAWFPAEARAAGLKTGRAVVRCVVDGSGALTGCSPTEETPPGMGFGQAAVTAAQAMAMSAWTQEGAPTEGMAIAVPVRLSLKQDEAAKPATKP